MKYDFAIIGSGIIGLTLAFKLKQKFNLFKSENTVLPKDINLINKEIEETTKSISNLIKYLKVPAIKVENTLYIRGEIIIPRDVFQKKFSQTFKNARNLVSGIVNSKRVNVKNASAMDFVCYDVIDSNMTPSQQMDFLKKHSFHTVKYFSIDEISKSLYGRIYVDGSVGSF